MDMFCHLLSVYDRALPWGCRWFGSYCHSESHNNGMAASINQSICMFTLSLGLQLFCAHVTIHWQRELLLLIDKLLFISFNILSFSFWLRGFYFLCWRKPFLILLKVVSGNLCMLSMSRRTHYMDMCVISHTSHYSCNLQMIIMGPVSLFEPRQSIDQVGIDYHGMSSCVIFLFLGNCGGQKCCLSSNNLVICTTSRENIVSFYCSMLPLRTIHNLSVWSFC